MREGVGQPVKLIEKGDPVVYSDKGPTLGDFSVAELLSKAEPGDEQSLAALMPLVYGELKGIAARELSRSNAHTLQPTALVHEAYLKLVGNDRKWAGRDHFMAVAAKAMRQVLVDHARRKGAEKRGGSANRSALSVEALIADERGPDAREVRVVELDRLLTELERSNERLARVAEMHVFGGMDQSQIARVMGTSRMTISRDWQVARAWLAAKVQDAHHDE